MTIAKYLAVLALCSQLASVNAADPAPAPAAPATTATTPSPSGSLLSDWGPIGTPAQVQATFDKAMQTLTEAGGGTLTIPPTVPSGVQLENTYRWSHSIKPESNDLRDWNVGAGVMVIDQREGTTRLMVPQLSAKGSNSGLVLNRVMRLAEGDSLQHWTVEAVLDIENIVIHGPVNYLDWIVAPTVAGPDSRFYVPQAQNLFKGMYLNAHEGPGYSGRVERITVKDVGYDKEKQSYYFTAHTNIDHKVGAIVQNKSHTPAIHIQNDYNASNQTFDFYLHRRQYGNGDSYLVDTNFQYMGNVHSMAGDENGNNFVAFMTSLTNVFRGKVTKVDSAAGWLEFNGTNIDTLGQSRPVINLNPAKWITGGTVMIVPAESYWDTIDTGKYPFEGKTYPTGISAARGSGNKGLHMGGLIRFSADAPVDASVIGQFFAVDDPTEYVPKSSVPKLRRWYEITIFRQNADGTKEIEIQRQWWGAKDAGSPTLYRESNYSWDGHLKPLSYVIAPGAYALDLREAVKSPKKRLGIAPPPVTGTPKDFAPGDDLEQAIGADPFKPQAFRTWAFDAVPGAWPASMFEIGNHGEVARDSAFAIQGSPSPASYAKSADQSPGFLAVMRIHSATNDAFEFNGATAHSALFFKQTYGEQPLVWQYGPRETGKPVAEARLAVDSTSGTLSFTGGAVAAPGGVVASGLSADGAPARNLRGKNVVVEAAAKSVTVTFATAEADADYAVFVESSWLGNRAITEKTATGFTVSFEQAAPQGARLDWLIVR